MRGIIALAFLTLPSVVFAQRTESTHAVNKVAPELKAYVDQLVPLVFALGDGNSAEAREFLEQHLYYPNTPTVSGFGGKQAAIDAQVSRFEQWKLDFESVDFMQYKQLSSQGYTVMLVANGNSGPVMFAFTVFRHRGKWQLNELTFQLAAATYRTAFPNVVLAKPVNYPRSSERVVERPSKVSR